MLSDSYHYKAGAFKCGSGAAEGTRTPDPIITNDVLYQLSYSGILLLSKPAGGADNDAALTIVVWVAKDLFFHFLIKQTIRLLVRVVWRTDQQRQ